MFFDDERMCGYAFETGGQCWLPFLSEWHYHDQEHPFSPAAGRPGECGWRLQGRVAAETAMVCGADAEDEVHDLASAGPGNVVPVTTPTYIHVTMQYPTQEVPVEPTKDWREGNVYPPDEDGGVAEAPTERLVAAFDRGYDEGGRKFNPDGTLPEERGAVRDTGDAQPEWSRAADYLRSDHHSLNYGPWPIRKFLLHDAVMSEADETDLYIEYLEALDRVQADYTVQTARPAGLPWRFALVTWEWANGYTIEVACDELAAMYG